LHYEIAIKSPGSCKALSETSVQLSPEGNIFGIDLASEMHDTCEMQSMHERTQRGHAITISYWDQ